MTGKPSASTRLTWSPRLHPAPATRPRPAAPPSISSGKPPDGLGDGDGGRAAGRDRDGFEARARHRAGRTDRLDRSGGRQAGRVHDHERPRLGPTASSITYHLGTVICEPSSTFVAGGRRRAAGPAAARRRPGVCSPDHVDERCCAGPGGTSATRVDVDHREAGRRHDDAHRLARPVHARPAGQEGQLDRGVQVARVEHHEPLADARRPCPPSGNHHVCWACAAASAGREAAAGRVVGRLDAPGDQPRAAAAHRRSTPRPPAAPRAPMSTRRTDWPGTTAPCSAGGSQRPLDGGEGRCPPRRRPGTGCRAPGCSEASAVVVPSARYQVLEAWSAQGLRRRPVRPTTVCSTATPPP